MHIYAIADNNFNVVEYIQNHLSDLIAIEVISEYNSLDGYSPINIILWSKQKRVKSFDTARYVSTTVQIIEEYKKLGIRCKKNNKKQENWLQSYKMSVKKGRAIHDKNIIASLIDDINIEHNMNKIINMLGDNFIGISGNCKKFCYFQFVNPAAFCRKIVTYIVKAKMIKKKSTTIHNDTVTAIINVVTEIYFSQDIVDIINNDDNVDGIEDYDNFDVFLAYIDDLLSEENYKVFLNNIIDYSTSLINDMQEINKSREDAGYTSYEWHHLGALISEISVILDDPSLFHNFFDLVLAIDEKKSTCSNIIMYSIAHIISRLENKYPNASMEERKSFLTPYFNTRIIQALCENFNSDRKTRYAIEGQFSNYLYPKSTNSHLQKPIVVFLKDLGKILHGSDD